MSKAHPNERDEIMVIPGCFSDERVIRNIHEHPSQIDADATYRTGYVSLEGKRVPVATGYWGDVEIWQLNTDAPDWPTCKTCGAAMDIGSAMIWQCWPCFRKAHPIRSGTSPRALA